MNIAVSEEEGRKIAASARVPLVSDSDSKRTFVCGSVSEERTTHLKEKS